MIILAHKLGVQFLLGGTKTATKATLLNFESMRRYDGVGVQSMIKYGGWSEYRGKFTASELLRMFTGNVYPWESLPQMTETAMMQIIKDSEIRREWCRFYYLALNSYTGTTEAEATARAWIRFRANYKESMTKDGVWEEKAVTK